MPKKIADGFDRVILLLQGGGALGAYQVGVFKAFHEQDFKPDWIIGTSIGAINSAIIAGNRPKERFKKLEQFWDKISTKMPPIPPTLNNQLIKKWQNHLAAQIAEWYGQPGFFKPRLINPWFGIDTTVNQLSFYDTEELRETLLEVINFDLINEKKIRLSMGAVHISTGCLIYFDNTQIEIKPEHVMASSAFPPGLPAVCIDGQMYWDGGIHSNTQINLLVTEMKPVRTLCVTVHLFDSYGIRPNTMDEVLKRQKDINYSSHHRQFIQMYRNIHNLRNAIHVLSECLSKEKLKDPQIKKLTNLGQKGLIHLMRFHYEGQEYDLSSKDYNFSWPSILEHIQNGYLDASNTLKDPPWRKPVKGDLGLYLHEVSRNPVSEDNPIE